MSSPAMPRLPAATIPDMGVPSASGAPDEAAKENAIISTSMVPAIVRNTERKIHFPKAFGHEGKSNTPEKNAQPKEALGGGGAQASGGAAAGAGGGSTDFKNSIRGAGGAIWSSSPSACVDAGGEAKSASAAEVANVM